MSTIQKLIAVLGATGQQGGAVVRALQASGRFKVRDQIALADKVAGRPPTPFATWALKNFAPATAA